MRWVGLASVAGSCQCVEGRTQGGGLGWPERRCTGMSGGTTGTRLAFGSGQSLISSVSSRYWTRDPRQNVSRRKCSSLIDPPSQRFFGASSRLTVPSPNYGDKSQYVGLDSTSEELLRQVQMLRAILWTQVKLYANRQGEKTSSLFRTAAEACGHIPSSRCSRSGSAGPRASSSNAR